MANKAWQIWQNSPFSWWQCQLNFALWCASAGCGVSFENHLQADKPLLASLYRFHVYHTARRLCVALPGDKSYSWYENAYDSRAYKRLCAEFSVSSDIHWRQKVDHGCQGLGSWSTFMTPSGAYRHAHAAQGPFFYPKDAMRHNVDISGAWTTFVLDKSEGFTQACVERFNDSICRYVWAILGAQAQTRSNVLKTWTGFDAQKQFLANIEDAIASSVDIPSSIARYQKTLQYASTPLDFVFGIGLYLSPSDMALHPEMCRAITTKSRQPDRMRQSGTSQGLTRWSRPIPLPRSIRHSKGRPPHQLGPFTRNHSLHRPRRESAQLTTTARQRLTLRRNGRAQRPMKKKKRPLWPLG